jgi:hypothetical protein
LFEIHRKVAARGRKRRKKTCLLFCAFCAFLRPSLFLPIPGPGAREAAPAAKKAGLVRAFA